MKIARLAARVAVGTMATVLATAAVAVPAAQAAGKQPGTRSLAGVLTRDTGGFDRNSRDFDVLTAAVLAVLDAKPNSPVKVLADGTVTLTAFVPTDVAFREPHPRPPAPQRAGRLPATWGGLGLSARSATTSCRRS